MDSLMITLKIKKKNFKTLAKGFVFSILGSFLITTIIGILLLFVGSILFGIFFLIVQLYMKIFEPLNALFTVGLSIKELNLLAALFAILFMGILFFRCELLYERIRN
jgi:hypothetical protein